jgi:hypothetical protein
VGLFFSCLFFVDQLGNTQVSTPAPITEYKEKKWFIVAFTYNIIYMETHSVQNLKLTYMQLESTSSKSTVQEEAIIRVHIPLVTAYEA